MFLTINGQLHAKFVYKYNKIRLICDQFIYSSSTTLKNFVFKKDIKRYLKPSLGIFNYAHKVSNIASSDTEQVN